MSVLLEPGVQKIVDGLISKGTYASVDEAVNDLIRQHSQFASLDSLRKEIALAMTQAERGEFAEFTAQDVIKLGKIALKAR